MCDYFTGIQTVCDSLSQKIHSFSLNVLVKHPVDPIMSYPEFLVAENYEDTPHGVPIPSRPKYQPSNGYGRGGGGFKT